jgi:hypothetical protein
LTNNNLEGILRSNTTKNGSNCVKFRGTESHTAKKKNG